MAENYNVSSDLRDVLHLLPYVVTEDFKHLTVGDVLDILVLMGMAFKEGQKSVNQKEDAPVEMPKTMTLENFVFEPVNYVFKGSTIDERCKTEGTIFYRPNIQVNLNDRHLDYDKLKNVVRKQLDKSMKELEELYGGDITI